MDGELHVICLCAEWCGTCRDWRPMMDELARRHPELHWRWLDIEEEAALMGELEVDTLPSLLVGRGDEVLFFGPVLPRVEVLARLLDTLREPGRQAGAVSSEAAELWQRIRPLPPSPPPAPPRS